MSRTLSISHAAAPVLITLLALSTSGCERAKTRLDREVDRLCAIDGGVHIYETVKLSKENFGPDGAVFPQYRGRTPSDGRYGSEYEGDLTVESIHPGNPGLSRIRAQIRRKSDNKPLGEIIDYKRSGGDMYGPWEPSHHSCELGSSTVDFEQRVFVKGS